MTDPAANRGVDLVIDPHTALRSATQRLYAEFEGTYGAQLIDRVVHASYEELAAAGTVPRFVPLLVERQARQRLTALALSNGADVPGERG